MKDPYYSRLNDPEGSWQETFEADDPPHVKPRTERFFAVVVVIGLVLIVAYFVS